MNLLHCSQVRNSFSELTLTAVIGYYFSIVLHHQPSFSVWSSVNELLQENRSLVSKCLFALYLFVGEENHWSVTSALRKEELLQLFKLLDVLACTPVAAYTFNSRHGNVDGIQVDTNTGINLPGLCTPPAALLNYRQHRNALATLVYSSECRGTKYSLLDDDIAGTFAIGIKTEPSFVKTRNIFLVCGPGEEKEERAQVVSLFAQLLLSDLVQRFTRWRLYTHAEYQDQDNAKIYDIGDLIFKGEPEEYLPILIWRRMICMSIDG